MGGYMGKQVCGPNIDTLPELNQIITRNGFRAKKQDWLKDLPPKVYHIRNVGMSRDQKKHYTHMLTNFLVDIGDGKNVSAHMVVTQMLKLQQISSGFVIDEDGTPNDLCVPEKLEEVRNILEDTEGKAIIPTYFRHSTDRLISYLEGKGYKVSYIRGQMQDYEIEEQKKAFNEGDADVIVCQSSAAKYGHTLLGTADRPCSTTIFYENSFSLDDRIQIEDRNHRIGQKHSVNIIDLVTSNVEHKVVKALQKKKDVASAIVDAVRGH
jgi:SNF2 family DNA or RNA helicase